MPIRPAVSVIPLRDGPDGIEVFVQHRQSTMDFAAGAVVFPGGRCDRGDVAAGETLSLRPEVRAEHVLRWSASWSGADPERRARTLLATGLRELAEETGMVADPNAMVPWDRWITPEGSPRRFDVAFYVLPVPRTAATQPLHRTSEATHSDWERAQDLLEAGAAGRVRLMTPTRVIIEELVALADVGTVMAHLPGITAVRDDRPVGRPRPSVPHPVEDGPAASGTPPWTAVRGGPRER